MTNMRVYNRFVRQVIYMLCKYIYNIGLLMVDIEFIDEVEKWG